MEEHDDKTEPEAPLDLETNTGELSPEDALTQERDELLARLQRVSADYMNYQKRIETDRRNEIDRTRGDVLKQFIPVLDHFDHALESAPDSPEANQIYGGLKIVRDELIKVLQSNGVTTIEPAIGDEFDPHLHEALLRQPAEGVEPNCITMMMQTGYAHGPRTLRAAKVAVAPAE